MFLTGVGRRAPRTRHFLFAKPFLLGLLRQKKRRQAGSDCNILCVPILVFCLAFFQKSERGVGAEPTEAAFLFCQAFFFVPFASKKKAPNKYWLQYFIERTVEDACPYRFVRCVASSADGTLRLPSLDPIPQTPCFTITES